MVPCLAPCPSTSQTFITRLLGASAEVTQKGANQGPVGRVNTPSREASLGVITEPVKQTSKRVGLKLDLER